MLGTGARYAEYGITGGFFLFTQALILGLAYPDVLVWGADRFGALLSEDNIPKLAQPACRMSRAIGTALSVVGTEIAIFAFYFEEHRRWQVFFLLLMIYLPLGSGLLIVLGAYSRFANMLLSLVYASWKPQTAPLAESGGSEVKPRFQHTLAEQKAGRLTGRRSAGCHQRIREAITSGANWVPIHTTRTVKFRS